MPLADIQQLQRRLNLCILGQPQLIDALLLSLLANGHILVEGPPGLAKTTAIKALAALIQADSARVQFTPDLLPADITGSDIYRAQSQQFEFQPGPIFTHLLLADEINRAPAKVQSALLEAMSEHQVSIGTTSHPLPDPFLVMATQNPIEQEGTYALPEAERDRFLMQVLVHLPNAQVEQAILQAVRKGSVIPSATEFSLTLEQVRAARSASQQIYMAPAIEQYIVQLTMATRQPQHFSLQSHAFIQYGVSPRGSISLERCAKAHAWLRGETFVSPDDVQAVLHPVFRHRLVLNYTAQAQGVTTDQVIDELLTQVAVA